MKSTKNKILTASVLPLVMGAALAAGSAIPLAHVAFAAAPTNASAATRHGVWRRLQSLCRQKRLRRLQPMRRQERLRRLQSLRGQKGLRRLQPLCRQKRLWWL